MIFILVIPVSATSIIAFPNMYYTPTDIDGDGKYLDCNGNGYLDIQDLILHWYYMSWMQTNQNISGFDYNGNTILDYNDSLLLYENITGV